MSSEMTTTTRETGTFRRPEKTRLNKRQDVFSHLGILKRQPHENDSHPTNDNSQKKKLYP